MGSGFYFRRNTLFVVIPAYAGGFQLSLEWQRKDKRTPAIFSYVTPACQ